jgi:hypothetical protein
VKRRYRTRGGRNSLPDKLAWLRVQGCMICGRPTEVHHDRLRGARANDLRTVPLCNDHHQNGAESVQKLGRSGFEEHHHLNMTECCVDYHQMWEDHRAG